MVIRHVKATKQMMGVSDLKGLCNSLKSCELHYLDAHSHITFCSDTQNRSYIIMGLLVFT